MNYPKSDIVMVHEYVFLRRERMSDHYYTNKPQSSHELKEISAEVGTQSLRLMTDSGVFSKNRMDFGSKLLVETFIEGKAMTGEEKVLELGSGYGPLLLAVAKHFPLASYVGVEVNERALELAQQNTQLNKVANVEWLLHDATTVPVEADYDYVLTNPPIRAGKQVIREFVLTAEKALKVDGELWLVIQKKQGAPSMSDYMEEIFGNVELMGRDKGYWILKSVK